MAETLQLPTEETALLVFKEVQAHKAMPFLEIAGITGLRLSQLKDTVQELAAKKLVKINGGIDPSTMIVSVSGSFH
jgi:hypothetical protein